MKRRCGARVLVMRNTRSTVLLERRGVKVRGCAFCDHFKRNCPSHRNFDSRDGRPDNLTTPQQIKELRYPNVRSLPCWAGIVTSLVRNFVEDQIQATAA